MKLIYWVSIQETDSQCYNIRRRTKREVQAELDDRCHFAPESIADYSKPIKVEMEYIDRHDLVFQCLGEGQYCHESEPV